MAMRCSELKYLLEQERCCCFLKDLPFERQCLRTTLETWGWPCDADLAVRIRADLWFVSQTANASTSTMTYIQYIFVMRAYSQ